MAIVKVQVTCAIDQPNCFVSGLRNTLHAYTAPSATCIKKPASAIPQRLVGAIQCLRAVLERCFDQWSTPIYECHGAAQSSWRNSATTCKGRAAQRPASGNRESHLQHGSSPGAVRD